MAREIVKVITTGCNACGCRAVGLVERNYDNNLDGYVAWLFRDLDHATKSPGSL